MKSPRDLSRKEFNCRLMLRLNFFNLIPTAACGSFSLICGNIYISFWRPCLNRLWGRELTTYGVCYWSAVRWAWRARFAYTTMNSNSTTSKLLGSELFLSKFVKKTVGKHKSKNFSHFPLGGKRKYLVPARRKELPSAVLHVQLCNQCPPQHFSKFLSTFPYRSYHTAD